MEDNSLLDIAAAADRSSPEFAELQPGKLRAAAAAADGCCRLC
jgi:hypothetical protein